MLCHVDLINIFRKRKVVMIVFELYLWRRFPVTEFSEEMVRFMMKQTFFPPIFIRTAIQIKNTFYVDIWSRNQLKLKSDQNISYKRKYMIFILGNIPSLKLEPFI
jgi:hypothetical protein